jgi:nucleotide-binding universal stress UspA family protein
MARITGATQNARDQEFKGVQIVSRTVIWASDGSPQARQALAMAQELAGKEGRVVAVHAYQVVPSRGAGFMGQIDEGEIREQLRELVADLRLDGVDAEFRLVRATTSNPARAISKLAGEIGADMIVVGTPGHSPLGGLLLGSVSQQLPRTAPCPVLTVPFAALEPAVDRRAV